jgi:predicted RecB family nuclease
MLVSGTEVSLSASDLTGHLNCRYLTGLDLRAARGLLAKPVRWDDPVLEVLAERGRQHEQAYLNHLRSQGLSVTTIDGVGVDSVSIATTLDAMKAGARVIAQAALQVDKWGGRADVLLRVDKPSRLGSWSYEVVDTKLAQETKGSTVLQLCLYSDLLAEAQGLAPALAYVVTPETAFVPQPYRVAAFTAYYRRVRQRLGEAVRTDAEYGYPDPKPHCEVCRWRQHCDDKRRADDHLSLVAGISKLQIGELGKHDVTSTASLAAVPIPLPWKPERGAAQSYEKVREQARLQVEGRTQGRIIHECLPVVPGFGLCLLPPPSAGDVFLDFEGDPFVSGGGREFLFGYATADEAGKLSYTADWALNREAEKAAFERFVDLMMARLEQYPEFHIYHFAPYEPAALKRLMGRYATRESELDRMLRARLFVDLYGVVRHAIRASVESYSIKKLEPLYAFDRSAPLSDAGRTMAKVQACLELEDVGGITPEDRNVVEAYNRDDCLSAAKLRDWLEDQRSRLTAQGSDIPRPIPGSGEAGEELSERQQRIAELIVRLTHDIPLEPTDRTPEQQARWLLAYLLDWHRREEKATWWEYFRLSDLSAEDLLDERVAISDLVFAGTVGGTTKAPIHRYRFPPQDTQLRGGEDLRSLGGDHFGTIVDMSLEQRTIDVKKRQAASAVHPQAVFAHRVIGSKELAGALVRLGEHVAEHGIEGTGPYQAARDLLLRAPPRVGGQALTLPGVRGGAPARQARRGARTLGRIGQDEPAPRR